MNKKKIGFFGGCFNPPTKAHINLINQAIEKEKLDKVFFVPMGDSYEKKDLIEFSHRKNMIELAINEYEKMEIYDCLSTINHKMYAIDTFKLIEKEFADVQRFFIMGTDNYEKIDEWKSSNLLKTNYEYIILDRKNLSNTKDISSSAVRKKIKNNEPIDDYVTEEVKEYIYKNKLYL